MVIGALAATGLGSGSAFGQRRIPTRYIADRFFAAPVTPESDTLMLLIDTGGGGVWMIKPALERLGLNPQPLGVVHNDTVFTGGKFPIFDANASIPIPLGSVDT